MLVGGGGLQQLGRRKNLLCSVVRVTRCWLQFSLTNPTFQSDDMYR